MLTRIIRPNPEIEENRKMYKRIYDELVKQNLIESIESCEDNINGNNDEERKEKLKKKKKKSTKLLVNGKKKKKKQTPKKTK